MAKQKTRLVIVSTMSTQNSGLFDVLIARHEKCSEYNVSDGVIAVGTGKALQMAEKGEADVLFVHNPVRQEKFLVEGYGVNRRSVMHSDFVILGPISDSDRIKGLGSAMDAFELIAERPVRRGAVFPQFTGRNNPITITK